MRFVIVGLSGRGCWCRSGVRVCIFPFILVALDADVGSVLDDGPLGARL